MDLKVYRQPDIDVVLNTQHEASDRQRRWHSFRNIVTQG